MLAREAQVDLALCAVAGLTTEEIARAFMIPEDTLAKRIVRAKRKIVDFVESRTGSPTRMSGWSGSSEVLTVIYLVFNEGYLATSGKDPIRRDLVSDAEWLATLLMRLLPQEPEVIGLVAVIPLNLARWSARLDRAGRLVRLDSQDRSVWDRRAIADAIRLIERAAELGRPGPFQIEASIAAVHCEAPGWGGDRFARRSSLCTHCWRQLIPHRSSG